MEAHDGAWVSYGYLDSNERPRSKYSHPEIELGYDNEASGSLRNLPNLGNRLEQQRTRVHGTIQRKIMQQRNNLQRELLYDLKQQTHSVPLLTIEKPPNESNIIDVYKKAREWLSYDNSKYNISCDDAMQLAFSDLQMSSPRNEMRLRHPSDDLPDRLRLMPPMQNMLNDIRKKTRVRSAPPQRTSSTEVDKPSSRGRVQLCRNKDNCKKKFLKTGCEFCPVECRPLSSSSFNQKSSTGLQAAPSPTHFQYYQHNQRLQRPHSATTPRRGYIDITSREKEASPVFSNIAQSCKIHNHPSNASSSSVAQPPKQAWLEQNIMPLYAADGLEAPRVSDSEGSEDEGYVRIYSENTMDGADLKSEEAATDAVITDEDDIRNEGVRQEAERTYELVAADGSNTDPEPPTLVESPTPSLEHNSQQQLKDEEDSRLFLPAPTQSLEMLTGRTFVPGEDVFGSLGNNSNDRFSGIRVEIRSPEPLPVKRDPGPMIHLVDVVHPQEELIITEISSKDDEVESIPADRPVDDSSGLFHADDIADLVETDGVLEEQYQPKSTEGRKTPVSILKSSSSQEFVKSKTSSKVLFQLPDDDEIVKNEDLEEVVLVSPVATDEEIEITQGRPSSFLKPIPVVLDSPPPTPAPEPSIIAEPADVDIPEKKEEFDENSARNIPEELDDETEDVAPVITVTMTTSDLSRDKSISETRSSAMVVTPSTEKFSSSSKFVLDYQDPNDEALRKLLAPPDLNGFEAPEFPAPPVKAKKKRTKTALGGKKKKGKKKKSTKPSAPKPAAEPLFSYVPFAPDPIEEIKKRMASQRQENRDLVSAVSTMKKFDELCREKMKDKAYLFSRLALSKRICRFWLPMDLRDLQGVTPSNYLSRYCVVCKRRQKLYSSIFEHQLAKRKSKEPINEVTKRTLSVKDCQIALRKVHSNCVDNENITRVCHLVCLSDEKKLSAVSRVDLKLFISICALSERLFYNHFVTEDSEESENANRHIIEEADFDGLEWRLRNVSISNELRELLFSL